MQQLYKNKLNYSRDLEKYKPLLNALCSLFTTLFIPLPLAAILSRNLVKQNKGNEKNILLFVFIDNSHLFNFFFNKTKT